MLSCPGIPHTLLNGPPEPCVILWLIRGSINIPRRHTSLKSALQISRISFGLSQEKMTLICTLHILSAQDNNTQPSLSVGAKAIHKSTTAVACNGGDSSVQTHAANGIVLPIGNPQHRACGCVDTNPASVFPSKRHIRLLMEMQRVPLFTPK